jgi:hypothetical protein
MGLVLERKEYTPEISLYYQNDLPCELAEAIIRFVWLDQELSKDSVKFELVRDLRSKVYKMRFQDETYYLKSYTPQNVGKIVKNFFRPADAVRYFQTSTKISRAGLIVAQPVLALTQKRGIYTAESIFVTREVPGVDLHTYFIQEALQDQELRTRMINQLVLIWRKLVNGNLVHQDPCLGNFIVLPEKKGKDFQLALIDVDNIYYRPLLPRKLIVLKNLKKLKQALMAMAIADITVPQPEIVLFWDEFMKQYLSLKNC